MIKHITAIFIFVSLVACQNTGKKQTATTDDAWADLQQVTVEQLRSKSFGEAAESLGMAIQLAGDDMARWEYTRMGLVSLPPDLALPLVKQALKHKKVKKNAYQLFGFSKVYTQFKKLESALNIIDKSIDIERKEEFVYWRARLHLMLKNDQLAEQDYLWLMNQDNDNEAYISQYASLLGHMGRSAEASELLEQHKDNPQLLYKSIILALGEDKESVAKKQFEQLKSIWMPENMDDQQKLEMGELAYWLSDAEYSLTVLAGVKAGDKISQAKLIMGRVLMEQENYDRAIIMFRQAQNGVREHAVLAYLFEADAHRLLEEPKVGIRTLSQALDTFPDNSNLRYSRAMMYESQDQLSEMEKDLRAIIAADERHHDALNALGYSWADRNIKLDEALELIQKAHELKPDNVAILDSMGWIYYRLGDLDKARHYLELAIKDQVEDQLMLAHLLTVLKALGDEPAAARIEEQIKATDKK